MDLTGARVVSASAMLHGRRVVLVVLDGAGAGALPDAAHYGDAGADTLGHVASAVPLHVPHLERLGLGNVVPMRGVAPQAAPAACFGRMAQRSAGKDSTIGHWELMGLPQPEPFPTYPQGFPPELIRRFSERTGRGVLGNRPASGTEIIRDLHAEHLRTGAWIVYTSADSVFQVAAHVDVIPPEELHEACRAAAELLFPERKVLRVIARPYEGREGSLKRTPGRRDFNLPPPGATALDRLTEALCPVVTLGKVDSVFSGRGVTRAVRTAGNEATLEALLLELDLWQGGLYFANLVDFDMVYGHRNDAEGFARALEAFDRAIPRLLALLRRGDVLILTADHGCDPLHPGTDHTREYVPLLLCGPGVRTGVSLGDRETFADVGATVCEALGARRPPTGKSFWSRVKASSAPEVSRVERERVAWLRRRGLHGGGAG